MRVIRMNQVQKEEVSGSLFTGGIVTLQPVVTAQMSEDIEIIAVNFSKGAKNKFHAHANDQVLIVTAGKGIVATEAQHRIVEAGDVIHIPAGEKHWHGATQDSEFSHIHVGVPRSKLTQLEK